MERVRCTGNDHPLRSPAPSQSSIAGRTTTTMDISSRSSNVSHIHSHKENEDYYKYRTPTRLSDAASLIQRAAKSALLDEATPTSPYTPSPLTTNMRSLETPSLPAIPDEQDRKRFIGCLAAVLSSMYDYESYELSPSRKESETTTNTDKNTNTNNNINININIDNEGSNINDISGFFDFYESSDDDDDYDDESIDVLVSQNITKDNYNRSLLSKVSSTDTTDNFYSRRCQSFESMGGSSTTATATMTGGKSTTTTTAPSSTRMTRSTNNIYNDRNSNISNNSNSKGAIPQQKLKPMTSFRRQAANVQQMESNNNNNNNNSNNKNGDNKKTKLSRQRYLSRRYELYSSLLLESSELLLLEKSTSRAFLPMLSRVLVPQIHRTAKKTKQKRISTNDEKKDTDCSYNNINSKNDDDDEEEEEDPVVRSPDAHLLDNEDELSPFLDSLTPGAGFRCVSLLLLQHLLTSENGYDARIRHAMKKLSVLVLRRDMEDDPVERKLFRRRRRQQQQQQQQQYNNRGTSNRFAGVCSNRGEYDDDDDEEEEDSREYERRRLLQATRKYEALEQNIARRLILLSAPRRAKDHKNKDTISRMNRNGNNVGITREQFVRGVKIGGVGLVAGTLFALTGGLAAPGIAAGVAAVAGAAAGTAAVTVLTSATVVTTIFGVGGGGLAAYKMQRRTIGVTEFEFCRETKGRPDRRGGEGRCGSGDAVCDNDNIEAELFSVLCISGWLRDECDYQRPWGLQPTHPRIKDRLETLERFYSVYSPDHVPKCGRILTSWKGEEDQLWKILREKYGRDPDHLFPLSDVNHNNGNMSGGDIDGSRLHGALTLDQEEILDKLFVELGYHSVAPDQEATTQQQNESQMSTFEKMKIGWRNHGRGNPDSNPNGNNDEYDSIHGPLSGHQTSESRNNPSKSAESMLYAYESGGSGEPPKQEQDEENVYKPPKHLATVWDWKIKYGGEMYTVKWESSLLTQICDCVTDLAVDVVSGTARQILKQTIFHTLLSAVIWPSYLLNLANMIDGDWTIAVERADEAGVVLAKTLLYSRAGRRPVTLVGYSFGARIIYSCLKELARYQEEWEHYQELLEEIDGSADRGIHDHGRLAKYKQKMKGMREPASIVEDAVLLGLPNHLSLSSWRACRQLVGGRLVNCYSNNDLILSLMFQAKRFSGGSLNRGMGSILKPVCGTCPVEEPGVENIDCSDLILGHQDYCIETGKILERIRFGEPIRCVSEANAAVSISSNQKS